MNNKIKFFLFLVGNTLCAFSQKGTINGKINLEDLENKNTVIENTFVLLKSKTISDSTKIGKDLSFKFENLPADTFKVSFSRPSYPYNVRYIVYLKDGETENINVSYTSTCPYKKNKDGICPICKKKDKVIPIRYGLLAETIEWNKKPDKRKFKPGGCVVSDCQPSWFCERDQKDF